MRTIAAVVLRPNNEATRPARAGAKRVTTNYVPSDTVSNITDRLRAQYLAERAGIGAQRARLIAGLAWGGAHD